MSPEQYKVIADNIKRLRKLNKLTQQQAAEGLIMDKQYYAQLERCERNFTIDKVVQACKFFDVELTEIVSFLVKDPDTNDSLERITRICEKLQNCSSTQLKIVERYVDEILPLVR